MAQHPSNRNGIKQIDVVLADTGQFFGFLDYGQG
jgi:hypothetical protein